MPVEVVVLGSANLDVVLQVEAIPAPGETVLATGRIGHPGGKGLNQAVAAARSGARTAFVGALGSEDDAEQLVSALRDARIDTSAVRRVTGPSGAAFVVVQASGENAIVVDPGANASLTSLDAAGRAVVGDCRLILAQLEIPLAVVMEAAHVARANGATFVLNAAPAQPLPPELLALVDVLVVNEHEAMALTGATDPAAAIQALADPARDVVVTLGARGAVHVDRDGTSTLTAAPPVRAADTTGAGDAFVGALGAALAAGAPFPEAVRRAVTAGSLAVEVPGGVPSMPTYEKIIERLDSRDAR